MSEFIILISLGYPGLLRSSITGCHVAEAAVIFSFRGQTDFPVCLPPAPSPFAYIPNLCRVYVPQDCVATIPPYPHYIRDRGADFDVASAISDPDSVWIVRPQLFFQCTVHPLNAAKRPYNLQSLFRRNYSRPSVL